MVTILLIIIYLAFISLGLPDSMTGAAWPAIMQELGVPLGAAGLISIVTTFGTIISSLISAKAIKKFGTGVVTAVSVFLTAVALLGLSFSTAYWWILLMCIPLGIGAGAVDSGLNNYVALHYKASHMSWLHCFWGVGVTISPIIMSFAISTLGTWRWGYRTVAIIQGVLVLILSLSIPLWNKTKKQEEEVVEMKALSLKDTLKINGVTLGCLSFVLYCGVEFTCGQWGASYLVGRFNLDAATAAKWISMFYLGITIGRGISGFIALKVKGKYLIRFGSMIIIVGAIILCLPFTVYLQLAGLLLIGVGCAPIFPSLLHLTPERFGKENSQSVMGVQMAAAYIGGVIISPLFGLIGQYIKIELYSYYLLTFAILLFIITERLDRKTTIIREMER